MLYGIRNSSGAFNVFADRRDADKHFRNERKSYVEIGNKLLGPFETYEDASYEIVMLRKEGYRDDMRVVGMKA